MIPVDGLLVLLLYISLFYDIWCIVLKKIEDIRANKFVPVKHKTSKDHSYHVDQKQYKPLETVQNLNDTPVDREEEQNKLSEAVKVFQTIIHTPDVIDHNTGDDIDTEKKSLLVRRVSRVYKAPTKDQLVLSEAQLLDLDSSLTQPPSPTYSTPNRKLSEDNWEAKRVRSRKISRVFKPIKTSSYFLTKTLQQDSRLKSVPTMEEYDLVDELDDIGLINE